MYYITYMYVNHLESDHMTLHALNTKSSQIQKKIIQNHITTATPTIHYHMEKGVLMCVASWAIVKENK